MKKSDKVKPKIKKKKEVKELVNSDATLIGSKIPMSYNVKTVTSNQTTDKYVNQTRQKVDPYTTGGAYRNFWFEADLSAELGFNELEKDVDPSKITGKDALDAIKSMGVTDPVEIDDRLNHLGFNPKKINNKKAKKRLVEKKIGEEDIINKRNIPDDILNKKDPPNLIIRLKMKKLIEAFTSYGFNQNEIIETFTKYVKNGDNLFSDLD